MRAELKKITFGDVRDTEIISQCYKQGHNCKVIDNSDAEGNVCIIFISSNSIYFPNTKEVVASTIVSKDRYEWTNLAKLEPLKSKVSRFIFIRDVYKQWYITGINDEIDDIDKTVDYLKALVKGYSLIVVGNSSGGYLASLLSEKLHATRAFSISGQWDISDQAPRAPFVQAELDTGYDYITITHVLSGLTPVYYLYPAQCKWDQEQAALVREEKGIIRIPFKQEGHGATCYGFNLPWLFLAKDNTLIDLSRNAPMGGWKRRTFLFRSVGFRRGFRLLCNYYIHRITRHSQ